jgi:hypothetical protein
VTIAYQAHLKTVLEFPDSSFGVLMQYIQRCEKGEGSGYETNLSLAMSCDGGGSYYNDKLFSTNEDKLESLYVRQKLVECMRREGGGEREMDRPYGQCTVELLTLG